MSQLFINIVGFNASGKSTLAKKLEHDLNLSLVNGDDFRRFVGQHVRYFANVPFSHPTERYRQLNPLVMQYRFQMMEILLQAGQSVIFDGSGNTKEFRDKYLQIIRSKYPTVKTVLIGAQIDETTLLSRLRERSESDRWQEMYQERKQTYEPPEANEADLVLIYNQNNYDEILHKLKNF